MKRLTFALLAMAWMLPAPRVAAQEADPIKAALDKARASHEKRVEAARKDLLKGIEARLKQAADKADLPAIKRLESVKASFEGEGTLPVDALVAKPRRDYDDALHAAKTDLRKALEKAKADYVKARKVAEAEKVDAELVAMAPRVERKPVKEPPPSDPITGQWRIAIGERENEEVRTMNVRLDPGGTASMPGMLWRKADGPFYTIIFPRGGTAKVRLGPKGEQFDGKMTNGTRIHGNRKV